MELTVEQASILGAFLLENLEVKGCAVNKGDKGFCLFMHKLAITESPNNLLHAGYGREAAECFMSLLSRNR